MTYARPGASFGISFARSPAEQPEHRLVMSSGKSRRGSFLPLRIAASMSHDIHGSRDIRGISEY